VTRVAPPDHASHGKGDQCDASLWAEAATGDPDAFAAVYDRYADRIHGYCYRRSASWHVAEEITSGVFLEAWRRRADVVVDPDAGVLPWLYGVAANLLRNHARSRRRYERFLARIPGQGTEPDFSEEVDGRVDRLAALEPLRRALASLSDDDRDLLLLGIAEGLTPTQLATALNVPAGTVRSRLSRARRRLRNELNRLGTHDRRDVTQ
jgi:RNA polymerase sigma factor (sigma-70 family)